MMVEEDSAPAQQPLVKSLVDTLGVWLPGFPAGFAWARAMEQGVCCVPRMEPTPESQARATLALANDLDQRAMFARARALSLERRAAAVREEGQPRLHDGESSSSSVDMLPPDQRGFSHPRSADVSSTRYVTSDGGPLKPLARPVPPSVADTVSDSTPSTPPSEAQEHAPNFNVARFADAHRSTLDSVSELDVGMVEVVETTMAGSVLGIEGLEVCMMQVIETSDWISATSFEIPAVDNSDADSQASSRSGLLGFKQSRTRAQKKQPQGSPQQVARTFLRKAEPTMLDNDDHDVHLATVFTAHTSTSPPGSRSRKAPGSLAARFARRLHVV